MHTISIYKIRSGGADIIYQSYGSDAHHLFEQAIKVVNNEGLKTNEQYMIDTIPKKRLDNDMFIYNVRNLKISHPNSCLMTTDRLVFNIVIDDPEDKRIIEASRLEWMKSGFHAGI
jgi:hypothetical protein